MHKILIIADHRINRSPSQRYRFEQYLNYFNAQRFEWELSEIISEKDDKLFYSPGNYLQKAWILLKSIFIRLNDLQKAKDFDIIFIQREALLLGSSFFEKQFFKKRKVIFDFDDSIWLLDTSPENKKFEFLKNPDKTKINIAHAHCVIAGNSFLANYAKQFNPNTIVIPTTIDSDIHIPKPELRDKEKIVIGWSGSISTIKHFEIAIPALKEIQAKYPGKIEIQVIGQGSYAHPEINVVSKNWSSITEVNDLNHFDIGIMPLPNDEWVKGKCGLKGLSYMSCGIATVMSHVGVNPEIIEHGKNGYLAKTKEEWIDYLSLLIENSDLRHKIGLAGRDTVVKNYSVNANKVKYLEVLKSLIK
ncbi:MAG: glycosyltransferase family 4 protein [Bacteroidetes bacterium]|nr:glycosyltransferase family 4 protein [Bacteroidota bacterium]